MTHLKTTFCGGRRLSFRLSRRTLSIPANTSGLLVRDDFDEVLVDDSPWRETNGITESFRAGAVDMAMDSRNELLREEDSLSVTTDGTESSMVELL